MTQTGSQTEITQPAPTIADKLSAVKKLSEELENVSHRLAMIERTRETRNSIHALIFDKQKLPVVIDELPEVVYNDVLNILELYFDHKKKELLAQAAELIK